jgi:capsular polysaccharide biosynthesis protein
MDILTMMARHWLFLLIFVIIFSSVSFVKTKFFSTPLYSAEGTLYISNVNKSDKVAMGIQQKEVTLNELVTSQELLRSYVEVLSTDRFYNRVKSVSGLRHSINDLRKMVTLGAKNQTELLEIQVISTNPNDAFVLVQTIISIAPDEISWVFEGGSLKTLDYPAYSSSPLPNNIARNTLLAGIIGFIVSFAIVFIIELSDKRINSHDDITNKYDYYILGEIPTFKTV